jgi:hypothetical protein
MRHWEVGARSGGGARLCSLTAVYLRAFLRDAVERGGNRIGD